uniref:Uncharacterized protein n=1 Tax=Rhizophora mucronata TaxID=61149 RepID=A0A2P2J1L2_RHIMU
MPLLLLPWVTLCVCNGQGLSSNSVKLICLKVS